MSGNAITKADRDEEPVEAPVQTKTQAKKLYTAPEIVHELEMETRAGSPLMLFGVDPSTGAAQNPWDPEYDRR